MSFSNMVEILQEKNKNKIVLVRLGVFYTAIGKDAVFLSKQLGLKCICFKNQICKIGIPEIKIEYYLERLDIGYVVYHFNNTKQQLSEKYKSEGKYHKETRNNKNCLICKGIRCYEEDKYMTAVQKLLSEEDENNAKR